MQDNSWIPEDERKIIVRNVPMILVDLVVLHKGDVLLGKRRNKPAKVSCLFWMED
jgi:hypothetical protein